ncbi:stage II sporulation protein M [Dysgonomonas sp. 511]|uniref:stage II sporulation protein M n=1 Tax=Dysgonomonas sp. 511 TaxID=2302930 RepID=UPI0013D8A5E8|nr:stage II sporulation protein M [Dysgonomonas sp. 511]NDV77936.1 stage II sporulation protein M [Dysgonomonas sp. 511]
MREAAFIKENREKWQKIDSQTKASDIPSETLADNFIELTDDLSYARTFYPGSQTVRYLNQLTGQYFIKIYKYRKRSKGRFFRFWSEELPLVMYKYRKNMLYAFIFMFAGVLLGVFSQQQDSTFASFFLSPAYVNQTLENIEKGDPMAIYKDDHKELMFFGIATNNIWVAFYAFILGIFFSAGTVYILFLNGIMLGVFQYFFYTKGLLLTSALSIWLHGTLEISAIIIAGGAGLILGNSLLFPGTYKRTYALQKAAKDALKVVVGLVPVFLVAAFIESYLTRLTEMPIYFNLTIIGLSAAFIIWYFIYYPHIINKKTNGLNKED